MATLRRTRDGAGDTGTLQLFRIKEGSWRNIPYHDSMVEVGQVVRVGSLSGRSYSAQDHWTTTPVTSIVGQDDNYCRLRTTNSEYELWK